MKLAKGDIIALLDSDDLWKPNKLEKQDDFFVKHPTIEFVFTDMKDIHKDKVIRQSWAKEMPYYKYLEDNSHSLELLEYLFVRNCIPTSSVAFRKKAIKQVGYFNEEMRISEDREYWIRSCNQFAVGFVDESLVDKREHSDNLIQDVPQMIESRLDLFTKVKLPNGPFTPAGLDDLKRVALAGAYYDYGKYLFKKLKFAKSFNYLWLCFPRFLTKPTFAVLLLITFFARVFR